MGDVEIAIQVERSDENQCIFVHNLSATLEAARKIIREDELNVPSEYHFLSRRNNKISLNQEKRITLASFPEGVLTLRKVETEMEEEDSPKIKLKRHKGTDDTFHTTPTKKMARPTSEPLEQDTILITESENLAKELSNSSSNKSPMKSVIALTQEASLAPSFKLCSVASTEEIPAVPHLLATVDPLQATKPLAKLFSLGKNIERDLECQPPKVSGDDLICINDAISPKDTPKEDKLISRLQQKAESIADKEQLKYGIRTSYKVDVNFGKVQFHCSACDKSFCGGSSEQKLQKLERHVSYSEHLMNVGELNGNMEVFDETKMQKLEEKGYAKHFNVKEPGIIKCQTCVPEFLLNLRNDKGGGLVYCSSLHLESAKHKSQKRNGKLDTFFLKNAPNKESI